MQPPKVGGALVVGAFVVATLSPVSSLAAPTVGAPATSPAAVALGRAVTLTVTSRIVSGPSDPAVLANGVNLLRVAADNRVLAIVGQMKDDGTGGDTVGGDGVFTLRMTVTLAPTDELRLRVTAAFVKTVQRVLSPVTLVPIEVPDTTPPAIAITAPAALSLLSSAQVTVSGTLDDPTASVTVNNVQATVGAGVFTAADVPLQEGQNVLEATATDPAGNVGNASVTVVRDSQAPTISIVSPTPGSTLAETSPAFLVNFSDTGSGVVPESLAWQVNGAPRPMNCQTGAATATCTPQTALTPGLIIAIASIWDRAGNVGTAQVQFTIVAPQPLTITVTAPAPGILTRESTVLVTGTVSAASGVAVTVNGAPATLTGNGPYEFSAIVPLAEGANVLTGVVTDGTGRTASASVTVTRDTQPPLLNLSVPDRLTLGTAAEARAEATDSSGIGQVVFRVGGSVASVVTTPPYVLALAVPEGARNGDVVEIVAEAIDRAGNIATVTRAVRIAADGVVVGQVLSDATGFPIAGATATAGSQTSTTDERGRYLLRPQTAPVVVLIEKEGLTPVQRVVEVAAGVGTIPVDARLTPRSTPTASGAPVVIDGYEPARWTATLPAGSFPPGAVVQATALTPQGLPLLLPLGWSPVAAFELLSSEPLAAPVTASLTGVDGARVLVRHDIAAHTWRVVQDQLAPASGQLDISLDATGSYALVTPDVSGPAIEIPPAGANLAGLGMAPLPAGAVATASGEPPSLPSTGGLVRGKVVVDSPAFVPSGTIVQASVSQTFALASGETASEDKRYEDLILYQFPPPVPQPGGTAGTMLQAAFPVVPSRTYSPVELASGNIHVELLSGREAVRGSVGGSGALELVSGTARLSVPAGALPSDTVVSFDAVPLSEFAVTATGFTPLFESEVDFAGATLLASATLSHPAAGLSLADRFLVATIVRVDGVPRLTVVALARIVDGRLTSVTYPGLPGITAGGRYVFYRLAVPFGFVGGTTSGSGGPVSAVVTSAGHPFVAIGSAAGAYVIPALIGTASVAARVPGTNLSGAGTAQVAEGTTTPLDLILAAGSTTALVRPANGAVAVPVNTQLEISSQTALNPQTVTPGNVHLYRGAVTDNVVVPVRLVLSLDRRQLSVVPESALGPSTIYTLTASGLLDVFGAPVVVPPTTFVTADYSAPRFDTSRLTFSFPDANGNVQVKAPAGSLPPGTQLFVINSGNGVVVSFTALNDGSVQGELPASISDVLQITVTDPQGNTVTFNRSQYEAPDGTTAIGPGGGVVRGPGGVEVRVPEGALDQGVTLKLETFDASAFPERPDLEGGLFSSGLRLVSPQKPTYKKPLTLAFPVPTNLLAGARPQDA